MSGFRVRFSAAWIGVLLIGGLVPAAGAADRAMNIEMEDQFGTSCSTAASRGNVVVLVYAERHGAEAALALGRQLHLHFHPTAGQPAAEAWSTQPVVGLAGWPAGVPVPDVQVVPVASLTEVPRALRPVVRARMRKDSPQVPVWLDFEGSLERMFGIIPGEANIVVLDTAGRVQSVLSGKFDDQDYAQFVGLLDQLRRAAQPAIRVADQPNGSPAR